MHRRAYGSTQMQVSPSMDHIALARQTEDESGRYGPDVQFGSQDSLYGSAGNGVNESYHHSREISMSSFSKSPDILPR